MWRLLVPITNDLLYLHQQDLGEEESYERDFDKAFDGWHVADSERPPPKQPAGTGHLTRIEGMPDSSQVAPQMTIQEFTQRFIHGHVDGSSGPAYLQSKVSHNDVNLRRRVLRISQLSSMFSNGTLKHLL